ncbi:minor capsid protein [Streptomyces sp. NBC_01217]|uniref:minor capsid protein n=1 Tax=Streptomyces sp. NBC_01217 TaxID=2903779 RepID=UPI002E104963|nr:minor capsid protein [Streptomyces sp. NBC_01217]
MTQRTRLNYQGRRLWTSRGRRLASDGLRNALEHILAESRRIVPLEESTLERSGRVHVDGLEGAITYDTVYAVVQHENLDYKHAPGREAKYLEKPMTTERQTALALMAVPLRRWLRG